MSLVSVALLSCIVLRLELLSGQVMVASGNLSQCVVGAQAVIFEGLDIPGTHRVHATIGLARYHGPKGEGKGSFNGNE